MSPNPREDPDVTATNLTFSERRAAALSRIDTSDSPEGTEK
jgi:hypothetical protein